MRCFLFVFDCLETYMQICVEDGDEQIAIDAYMIVNDWPCSYY